MSDGATDPNRVTLTSDDLDGMAPRRRGWIRSVLVGIVFPFTAPYTGLSLACLFIYSVVVRRTHRTATYGQDSTIPVEQVVSGLLLPLAGFIATVGTGLGFYLLTSKPHTRPPRIPSGWFILALTLALVVEVVAIGLSSLRSHRSGRGVWPFEPDVDPTKAIAQIQEWRTARAMGFLPGRAIGAAIWANGVSALEPGTEVSATLREAWTRFPQSARDRAQLKTAGFFAGLWLIGLETISYENRGVTSSLLWIALFLVVAGVLLRASAAAGMVPRFYAHLRWSRRVQVLRQRQGRKLEDLLREVSDGVARLADEVRELRAGHVAAPTKVFDGPHLQISLSWRRRQGTVTRTPDS